MPQKQTKAIVLGSSPLREQDKLVVLLTEENGIVSAVAPGASKYKNRFGSVFELFTEGDFIYYEKETKELVTISRGDIITSNFFTVADSRVIFYFYLIAEVIRRFLPRKYNSKRVYNLIRSILESSTKTIPLLDLLLYFLVWILRIEGVLFRIGVCSNCLSKNLREVYVRDDFRGVLCGDCRSNEKICLSAGELRFVDWTKNNPSGSLIKFKPEIDRKKMVRLFVKMIEFHAEISLKTTSYFPEIFL
jgi:DNA repair protein RecO (recombination protein O)